MTAPDAPKRALWRCESCGHIFTEWPIPGVSVGDDGHEVIVPHPRTGEPEQEPCGEVVRYTPARRDDTAELIAAATELLEATEAANAWESGLLDSSPSDYEDWEAENRTVHERHANAYAALAAALARVKGEQR